MKTYLVSSLILANKILEVFKEYIRYRRKAIGKQKIHSPFVFSFYNEIVKKKKANDAFKSIEILVEARQDKTLIAASNFGAKTASNEMTSVASVARKSGVNKRWGSFLYEMSRQHGSNKIIELGTNLGIGTAFLCEGNPEAEVVSFEGNPDFVRYAFEKLNSKGLTNFKIIEGRIQDHIKNELKRLESVDLVYIDADHTYEATLHFFQVILPFVHQKTILIFDDIYWSEGMTQAWNEIIKDSKVRVSVDLYFKGVITFDDGLPKQHFVLKH